jgi:prepilin-type N-terminal cleavage/methylation domain-containing protein
MSRSTAIRGFTLVEILCVVVILGISAAIIIPQIGTRDDVRTASMARVLMADMQFAQSRAVSLQKAHYVRFNTTNNTYEVLDQLSPSDHLITHPITKNNFSVTLGSARKDDLKTVVLDQVTFDGRTIVMFDDLGTPYWVDGTTFNTGAMAAGSIRLRSGTYTMTITIEPYSGELHVN